MANAVEPAPITRHVVSCVEPWAGENVCGDLRTFLRRISADWMHLAEFGRQHLKHPKLASDPGAPPIIACLIPVCRVGMDQLPDPRHPIALIGCQQLVKKRRSRARQARDKNWSRDRLLEDFWRPQLLIMQSQQIGEKAADIPARRKTSEEAQIRLLGASTQKDLKSLLKPGIVEILKPGAATRP